MAALDPFGTSLRGTPEEVRAVGVLGLILGLPIAAAGTAEFAVESLRRWWKLFGRRRT